MSYLQLGDLTKDLTALKNASPGDIAKVIESYHEQVRKMLTIYLQISKLNQRDTVVSFSPNIHEVLDSIPGSARDD